MKNALIAIVVAAIVATGISFGAARWFTQRQQSTGTVNIHDAGWLRRELNLTDGQVAQVAKLAEDYRTAVNQCCMKHCDARLVLSVELAKPQVDLPAAQAAVGKMCAAANDVEQATLQHILRVREILTPQQQQRYAALINQQLCTAYPSGMSQP